MQKGSLLERDYLYARCQCRRIFLFLLHLLPNLWSHFSLNAKSDSVDSLKVSTNTVSSLNEICGCVFAAFAEMKFFDEEADKMELYSRDASKGKLFVDFTKEEYTTNDQGMMKCSCLQQLIVDRYDDRDINGVVGH
jgi:hypothetical protein